MHLLANGAWKVPPHIVSFLKSSKCFMHSNLTARDACTACMHCIVMQVTSRLPVHHMLCRCACLMVKIRPKWTRLCGSLVEEDGQQPFCTTHAYAVQLRMSGQDSPPMEKFADLHASTMEAELHLDLKS